MKNLIATIFIITIPLVTISFTKFCSPVKTPFNELLAHYNSEYNSAVEGYFVSSNTFKVTHSYDFSIKPESVYKVFEYGPFGSACEMYEMGSNIDSKVQGVKNSRLLILNKSRSKNGKLVTPIFHGEGVSTVGKTVTFNRYYITDKNSTSKLHRFSTSLSSVRNRLQQKTATTVKWKTEDLKQR